MFRCLCENCRKTITVITVWRQIWLNGILIKFLGCCEGIKDILLWFVEWKELFYISGVLGGLTKSWYLLTVTARMLPITYRRQKLIEFKQILCGRSSKLTEKGSFCGLHMTKHGSFKCHSFSLQCLYFKKSVTLILHTLSTD